MIYSDLLTSNQKKHERFVAIVDATTQPMLDQQKLMMDIFEGFDIEKAVGMQLDRIGERVGFSRRITVNLTDIYFEFDQTAHEVGWNEGIWKDTYSPDTTTTLLSDFDYRIMLKAKIAANMWDGSTEGVYATWSTVFPPRESFVVVYDMQDMSILVGLVGAQISETIKQLVISGYLPLKPCGVRINWFLTNELPSIPPFMWNTQTGAGDGWNLGYWTTVLTGA